MNHESNKSEGKKHYEPPRLVADQSATRRGGSGALQDVSGGSGPSQLPYCATFFCCVVAASDPNSLSAEQGAMKCELGRTIDGAW